MSDDISHIRNIGIIAHIDAGKTTVTERMLYVSGAKHFAGGVDKGTTETDTDPEEQDRGITIYSACVKFRWKDVSINLLDTPGHVDFTAEVERCLRVLDSAVVVFSAREGVEAQSETVWRQADKYNVPRVAFINKLDREGARFEEVIDEMKSRLGANPLPIAFPHGRGPAHVDNPHRGVIDLIEMKYLTFADEGKTMNADEVPEDIRDEAQLWRENMLESLYEHSDEMAELALAEEEIPVELIRATLRKGCIEGAFQPLLCGSALHGIGVQTVLDAVQFYLPSPLERPPVEGTDPKNEEKTLSRKPDSKEPFCGLVFKILPAKTGDLYWIRTYSGVLKSNSRLINPVSGKKENISQLWQIHAQKRDAQGQVDSVPPGDIVGVIGPRFSVTGDTLCDGKDPIVLPGINFTETVLSMAIEPETTADKKKLAEALEMLKRQDPTFKAMESEETGQTIVSGMGELHLEVIKHRLPRDFNLNVKFHKPRVSYCETIAKPAEVVGECHRVIEGKQLFAKVKIKVEPDASIAKVEVVNQVAPETLPKEFIAATMESLTSQAEGGGPLAGFPLTKLRVTFLGGEQQMEGSTETAFAIAAADAFNKAMEKAGDKLLEPVMKIEIATPPDYFGDIIGDLQQRRGLISQSTPRGDLTMIDAKAPLAELFGYTDGLRSVSQGRATASMEFLEFDAAPEEVVKKYRLDD
jgi:elongation factor G